MSDLAEAKSSEAPASASSVAVVVWGLAMYAGCRAIEILLEAQSMAAAVGQAVLVEWGSSRLGVVWSSPPAAGEPPVTAVRVARRAGVGAAVGLAAAATLFVVLLASRGIAVQSVTKIEPSIVGIGLLTAAVLAWRDELLLHGVTLRALEAVQVGPLGKVLACGMTSAGAALGRPDATPRTVFTAALLGAVFGALWVRDRGAWQPWATNTAFSFATGTILSGGFVQTRLADDAWAGGSAGILGGTAATIAFVPLAVLALGWAARRISPPSPKSG
jgi:hypothetical protein